MIESNNDDGAGLPGANDLVRLSGVGKTFPNDIEALREMNFHVGRGEFVSLLGPSGCGKSTALRLISRLAEPSAGRIAWHEALSGRRGRLNQDIGFVFQDSTLMPWANVLDNVLLPLRLVNPNDSANRDRALEALRQVQLADFAHSYPRELSGGMKMRASIARALVTRPTLLLMDEPFAALDEITRLRLNDDLLNLWYGQDWTVVFVTHSIYESVFLSSRVAVMSPRPGRVVEEFMIDQAYPRSEEFRLSREYAEFCRRISASLKQSMGSDVGLADQ